MSPVIRLAGTADNALWSSRLRLSLQLLINQFSNSQALVCQSFADMHIAVHMAGINIPLTLFKNRICLAHSFK